MTVDRRGAMVGMTLVELLVAMVLASLVSVGVLFISRVQLTANELNDQLTKAQQNGRAGVDYLETILRRACAGVAAGGLGVNVPGVPRAFTSCIQVWDGANLSGGTFTVGTPDSLPDAVEVVYADGTAATVATAAPNVSASPSVTVADVTGFAVGDFVLIGDYQQADLFRVSAVQLAAAPSGTLSLGALSGPVVSPNRPVLTLGVGSVVLHARCVSIYAATADPYAGMLMLDPDGLAGVDHNDAQPLVESVADFQLAVGVDFDSNGVISAVPPGVSPPDEWMGNVAGEGLPATPWNRSGQPDPQLRQIRATLVAQTTSGFAGAASKLGPYEDRTSYPAVVNRSPRYRPMRIEVAPRAWNLAD